MKKQKISKLHKGLLFFSALLIGVFIIACGDDDDGGPTADTYSLKPLAGNNQTGEVEKALPEKIQVRFVNQDNVGKEGIVVDFIIPDSEGNVTPDSKVTDADGVAEVTWTLGDKLGEQTLQAKVNDGTITSNTVEFKATAMCQGTVSYSGKDYEVVTIGDQCWFAENLNVGSTAAPGDQVDDGVTKKLCYSSNTSKCDTYGGLYKWGEAMKYSTAEKSKGICPDGWHIPSKGEWDELISTLGGSNVAGGKLKSVDIWDAPNTGGDNSSGFEALPGGAYILASLAGPGYWGEKKQARFWTSTVGSSKPLVLLLNHDKGETEYLEHTNDFAWLSCRCVKD